MPPGSRSIDHRGDPGEVGRHSGGLRDMLDRRAPFIEALVLLAPIVAGFLVLDFLAAYFRDYSLAVPDAPGPDEILVAIGAATTGRAFPRIGNRYMDMEEMAAEKKV